MSRTLNTVRRLILRRGGKHVTIVTYGILGGMSKQFTVPVTHVRIQYFTSIEEKKLELILCCNNDYDFSAVGCEETIKASKDSFSRSRIKDSDSSSTLRMEYFTISHCLKEPSDYLGRFKYNSNQSINTVEIFMRMTKVRSSGKTIQINISNYIWHCFFQDI